MPDSCWSPCRPLPGRPIRRAFERGQELGLEVRTVPHPRELLGGETLTHRIRRVSVDDLLRREPVDIDTDAVAGYLNGMSVLVTGGGGSIGSELVRQILAVGPRLITVVDNHEEALWSIERELAERIAGNPGVAFEPVLADVRSPEAVDAVIGRARPEVVFHAAALKHVPIVELSPAEGVMTNVIGSGNVISACERLGVKRFVLISTDKAVEPIGVMGATKRLAELLTVASARRTGRPYVAVRFGNVLGSSGSVIPIFQRQLEQGRPLTITHADATRFFMTIPEAVSLILQAGATAGERRHLRPGHGRAGQDRRPGPRPDPPFRPGRGAGARSCTRACEPASGCTSPSSTTTRRPSGPATSRSCACEPTPSGRSASRSTCSSPSSSRPRAGTTMRRFASSCGRVSALGTPRAPSGPAAPAAATVDREAPRRSPRSKPHGRTT